MAYFRLLRSKFLIPSLGAGAPKYRIFRTNAEDVIIVIYCNNMDITECLEAICDQKGVGIRASL